MKTEKQSETTKLPFEDNYVRLRWRNLNGETIFKCDFKRNLGEGDFETFMENTRQAYIDNVLTRYE